MKMLLAVGGLGFVIAIAITLLVVRAVRRARRNEDARRRGEEESRLTAEAHRRAEQDARLEARRQHRVEEEARVAAEAEAQRRAEEELRREAELEARRRADERARAAAQAEERRRAEEEARVAADQEALRRAEEEARRKAEEARVAAEAEARHRAEEEWRRETEAEALRGAEEQGRVAAETEARHEAEVQARVEAEETRRRAEEEARRKAEEARVTAEADSHRKAEDEARRSAEQQTRLAAGAEARHRADQEARLNAEADARRKVQEETRREAEDDACPVLPTLGPVAVPMDGSLATPPILNAPAAPIRDPRQYRPVPRVPAVPTAPRTPVPASVEREARDRAMPIEIRLVFERAGFCRVSLLPRRAAGMPLELAVTGSGDPPELLALQDEWYQDVVLPNLERMLREGVEWAGALSVGQQARWSLSGREIYVLARHSELYGFVSAPRLILGEEHVVLCVADRLSEVHAAIALTGSPEPTLLNSDSGIPAGWAGLRGVLPRMPIAPSPAGDILDALRPLAEVEIALEGGIRIARQTWLSGFPPSVRLRGDTSTIGAVTIDGHDATLSADGSCAVPGWDSPGEHSVWCTSASRTYAIRGGAEDWESWDAYTWSLGEVGVAGTQSHPAICGVLVRPPRAARSGGRAIVVPVSNPVLIGAGPGEIEICTPRSDVRAGLCMGFPWFEPIWAIPADALHCDKRTARVLLIGSPQPVAEGEQQPSARPGERRARFHRGRTRGGHAWCEAIITAGGRGLRTEPLRAEVADLWKAYKRSAKALRRSWR
jgi:hypothetical protein